jgi:hypothetical protein
MRLEEHLETRAYLFADSLWTSPVDLRILGSVAHSLEDGCLPCICPSDNEDPELNCWDSGATRVDVGNSLLPIPPSGCGRVASGRFMSGVAWFG